MVINFLPFPIILILDQKVSNLIALKPSLDGIKMEINMLVSRDLNLMKMI